MGMFDYIECVYPLPGLPRFVGAGHRFQTKDAEPLSMDTHSIDANGRISIEGFSGDLEFYTSNIVGVGPGVYTRDGEDAESVTYVASFKDGQLQRVERTSYECEAGMKNTNEFKAPTVEELKACKARVDESLEGRTVYVWPGGDKHGYEAWVVHENAKQVVLESGDKAEVRSRSDRDRIFFDSREAALRHLDEKRRSWEAKKAEYDQYAAEWEARRASVPALGAEERGLQVGRYWPAIIFFNASNLSLCTARSGSSAISARICRSAVA